MMMTSSHDLQVIKNVPSLLHINPAHTCDVNSHLGMAMAIRSERRQSGLRAHATHNRLRQHDRSNAAFFHQDKFSILVHVCACALANECWKMHLSGQLNAWESSAFLHSAESDSAKIFRQRRALENRGLEMAPTLPLTGCAMQSSYMASTCCSLGSAFAALCKMYGAPVE
jgi:hypothetical protein